MSTDRTPLLQERLFKMNLIRLLLHTSWLNLTLAAIAGCISGISATGLIALINTTLSHDKPSTTILVGYFASLCLIRLIASFASYVLLSRLSQGAIFNLRMLLCQQIIASPLHQLETIGASRILANLTDDIQSISNVVFIIPFVCIDIAIIASCLAYLCWLSWAIFLFTFGFMVLGLVTNQLLALKAISFLKLAREQQDNLFKHFRAMTEGMKELKLHRQRRQAFLLEELKLTAISSQRHNIDGMTIYAAAASSGQILFFVAIGVLLFIMPSVLNISAPILSSYALTIIFTIAPMEDVVSKLPILGQAAVALKKIESLGLLLTNQPAEKESTIEPSAESSWQRLELRGVTHAYHREREGGGFTLGPIDLTLSAGELVFLVGGNGSGKSTLAKLITGLYVPETGEISLDGQPINDENREWYRQHFSVVFSDFYLFERLLGIGCADVDPQAREYLVQLQLDHKVQVKDGVLSTTALSQGQRKRLALLTAYLENRPIYLFDEWASDQDPFFREIFYKQLLPELKRRGKTVLTISHDDQYFYLADRIIKLNYGKLVSSGTSQLHDKAISGS